MCFRLLEAVIGTLAAGTSASAAGTSVDAHKNFMH